jgi:flagellar assembly protein FliH
MSTLIKQSAGAYSGVPFNLADIALEAKSILRRAQQQAQQIVSEATKQAGEIREQARAEGHEQGMVAGREEGAELGRQDAAKQFDQQIARTGRMLGESIEQLEQRRGRMLAEARRDLVQLAMLVAEKVVRRHLSADPDAVIRAVEAAVELAGQASRLIIRVNPQDLQTAQEFAPQLADRLSGGHEVQVTGDEQIEAGGARIAAWHETAQGSEIDARIQTQIDRIASELLGLDPDDTSREQH